MSIFGVFGINNSGLNLAVNLLILFVIVLWLALIYWTYSDAKRRIEDPMLVACATVASFFPFIGTAVYAIIRPPEYLEDVRERKLELQAAQARLMELDRHFCSYCDHPIESDFLRCPSCLHKLRDPCRKCSKPLDPSWRVCPYCETEQQEPSKRYGSAAERRQSSGKSPARKSPAPRPAQRPQKKPTSTQRVAAPPSQASGERPPQPKPDHGQTQSSTAQPFNQAAQ